MEKCNIKVTTQNIQKTVKIPSGIRLLVRKCCNAALATERFSGLAEVSVTFVDNAQIRELNREHRNKDIPTDVLSFPLGTDGEYDINLDTGAKQLGDIVISIEKALEQSQTYGHSLSREVGYLTVHSMFHLLGYDHEAGGLEFVHMREKEESTLTKLGLKRDESYCSEE